MLFKFDSFHVLFMTGVPEEHGKCRIRVVLSLFLPFTYVLEDCSV